MARACVYLENGEARFGELRPQYAVLDVAFRHCIGFEIRNLFQSILLCSLFGKLCGRNKSRKEKHTKKRILASHSSLLCFAQLFWCFVV
jgi:hypothetical protein